MRTVFLALTNLLFAISMFVGVFAVWDFTLGKWMNGCASTVIAGLSLCSITFAPYESASSGLYWRESKNEPPRMSCRA